MEKPWKVAYGQTLESSLWKSLGRWPVEKPWKVDKLPTWEVKEYFWLLHAKETGISYSGLGHLVYVQKSFFTIKKDNIPVLIFGYNDIFVLN